MINISKYKKERLVTRYELIKATKEFEINTWKAAYIPISMLFNWSHNEWLDFANVWACDILAYLMMTNHFEERRWA